MSCELAEQAGERRAESLGSLNVTCNFSTARLGKRAKAAGGEGGGAGWLADCK